MTQTEVPIGVHCQELHNKRHSFFMLTQMNIKKWLQKLGEKGYNNLLKELRQLDNKEALIPVKKEHMLCEDQRKHLRALINLDLTIKECGFVDGTPQVNLHQKKMLVLIEYPLRQ